MKFNNFLKKYRKINENLIYLCLIVLLLIIISEIFFETFYLEHYNLFKTSDLIIITIFAIDLIYKYFDTKNFKFFLKKYWIEILAIFPFSLFFTKELHEVKEISSHAQSYLHSAIGIEKEGAMITRTLAQSSRLRLFIKFIQPTIRSIRFLAIFKHKAKLNKN